MTTRRQFLRGAFSAAVAASIPGGDGVALNSATHPPLNLADYLTDSDAWYLKDVAPTPVFLPFVSDRDTGMFRAGDDTLKLVVGGVRRLSSLEELEIDVK